MVRTGSDWNVFALGTAKITAGDASVDPSAELVFAIALYLALESREPTPRRFLQGLLWPDTDDRTASHRLRQSLFKLRRMGFAVDSDGKSRLHVVGRISTDYERLETSCSAPLDNELGFPILAGFEPQFSWRYSEWLEEKKTRISAHLTRVLLGGIGHARLTGHWPEVESLSRNLLRYSPDNEEATLALAESLAMRGDKIQGVRVLDNYLADIGSGPSDLRLSATLMRRRIADRMPPRDHDVPGETPLFGREQFLEELATLLTEARHNRPQAVVIWGAPGIGKTRLLTEFLSFASLQGVAWHRVSCRSTDAARPLAMLLELIPLLRAMRGAVGSAPETLAFFEALTKHSPKKLRGPHHAAKAEITGSGLDAALADVLDAVAEEIPLLIAIEDCQWMDPASATVIARLVQKLSRQRLLLILTSRVPQDGPLSTIPIEARDIQLPTLNDEASSEILHAIIRQKGRSVSSDYVDWCARVAEGNPFFLHELANHWLETGEIHVAPASLTAILRGRLARISPNSLQVLQTCALLENNSTLDNLEAVLGYPGHVMLHSINELASAGMITTDVNESPPHTSGRIGSRHDLLSEVALIQLAPAARIYLHRRAARVLEESMGERGDASILWSCAKHWQLAGDVDHAFRLATSCATHLLEAGLPSEAAEAFARAATYCSSDSDLLGILEGQATAYYRSSDWRNVVQTVAAARSLKQRLQAKATQHDELELMALRAEWQTLNWNSILSKSLECLDAVEATAAHRVDAGSMALMLLSFQGDGLAGQEVFAKILSLASDPDVRVTSALQATMVFHTNWGSFDDAVSAAVELVEHNRSHGDIGLLFRSLCNAAVTFRAAGRFDAARGHLQEALSLADRHHLQLSKSRAIPMLANMELELGNISEAKFWLSRLQESSIGPEDKLAHAEVSTISARIALVEGRYAEALALVQGDLAHMRNDQVPHRRAYAAALRVAVEVANYGKASRTSVRELETEYLASRKNVFQAFATYSLYVGLLSIGERPRAAELLEKYATVYRREPWPLSTHLHDSMMALLGGSREAQA